MSENDPPEVLFRARLQRQEKGVPWGFRLQGGAEFSKPLTLLKVIPDSLAARVGLHAGDILVRLAGQSAVSMTHRDAQQAIVTSGNSLEIIVERADVTCPSLSIKGQLEVNDLTSESSGAEIQNDLKKSGMIIEEESLNSTTLVNSEKIFSKVTCGKTDSKDDVISQTNPIAPEIEPECLPNPSSPTKPPTPTVIIPTNETPATNHPATPVDDEAPAKPPVSPAATCQGLRERGLQDSQQNASTDSGIEAKDVGDENARNDEKFDDEKMMMTTTTTGAVLTDHNANIPLVPIELQNSVPVQALIKTNALTSELGDDSSEVTDDQSSEFSDDISVIEMPTEGSTSVGGTRGAVEEGEDEEAVPEASPLFYQDEAEYREISLLNFDHRFLDPVTPSGESSVPETEVNRMRACFYLPSLGSDLEAKGDAVQPPPMTAKSGGPPSAEKFARDFSQTAPWRLSSRGTAGGSRRTDDSSETTYGRALPVKRSEPEALSTASTFVANDRNQQRLDYPVTDNVIYIPISIFDKQLRLGSDYTFQLKSSGTSGAQTPEGGPGPLTSLTLMGRRSEERKASNQEHQGVPQSTDDGQTAQTLSVAVPTAGVPVTMTTATVYIAPMTSQSTARAVPSPSADREVPGPTSSATESRRLSSEVLYELQDIPLPPVKDIVADLNSRLVKVAENYETSTTGSHVTTPSLELGTSFGRPERRRSSSGSESEKEILIDAPPFSQGTQGLLRDQLPLPDQHPPTTYRSVVYRTDLSPKPSIRRFSLPGSSVTVKDSVQRRVRFAEPPESSVIEIEGRQRHRPASERIRPVSGVAVPRDGVALAPAQTTADAEYVSVSSLAEKLDRIELENALASAAMKRSRPFQAQVSNLLASHPAHPDIRASSPKRGTAGIPGRAAWKLEPIQERVINIQTFQSPDARRNDPQFRIATQRSSPSLGSVQCSSDFGGIFSLSIGPSSGGHLNLSLQQHPGHSARQGHSPTKVNLVLPSAGDVGKSERFSYSVSTAGVREPIRYALPPSYEESVLAMAAGRHPRSYSLDDARQAAGSTVFPSRVSELRAESQLIPVGVPQKPGVRMMRAQSPTVPGASHPGWVTSTTAPPDQDPRRTPGYSQTLQVDTGSRQVARAPSSPLGLPVFHARSGAMSATDLVGYQAAGAADGSRATDPFLRIVAHNSAGSKPVALGDQSRQEVAGRFGRSGSPLILSPTGISGSGSTKPLQGGVRPFSPISSPPGSDGRRPPPQRLQDTRGPHPGPTVAAAAAADSLHPDRRWPPPLPMPPASPTVRQPPSIRHEAHRLDTPPSTARMFLDARGLPPPLQRMPGIFALLDKTFTDKVMQWEGPNRSGGLQQSETYKLVREMDDAMKQDKL